MGKVVYVDGRGSGDVRSPRGCTVVVEDDSLMLSMEKADQSSSQCNLNLLHGQPPPSLFPVQPFPHQRIPDSPNLSCGPLPPTSPLRSPVSGIYGSPRKVSLVADGLLSGNGMSFVPAEKDNEGERKTDKVISVIFLLLVRSLFGLGRAKK